MCLIAVSASHPYAINICHSLAILPLGIGLPPPFPHAAGFNYFSEGVTSAAYGQKVEHGGGRSKNNKCTSGEKILIVGALYSRGKISRERESAFDVHSREFF